MKITYIVNEINNTTGLEKLLLTQINYLIDKLDYEIDLILVKQKSFEKTSIFEINDKVNLHYLDVENKGFKKFLNRIKRISSKLKKINPEIVIVCIDEVFGLYLATFLKKTRPFIYQRSSTKNLNFIDSNGKNQTGLKASLKRIIMSRSGLGYDSFVVLTDDDKLDWQYLKKVDVIHCPFVLNTNGKQSSIDNKVVLAVGRQDYVKGFDMLLKAWGMVIKKHPDWVLKFYGKFNASLKLEEIASDLEISKHVEFHEHTNDIISVYLNASILVCSSRTEGFPLTMIEAMSVGVPVVSFDCPNGPRAIINNNEDGILVEPNNIVELSNSLQSLMTNDKLRGEMGEAAKYNSNRFSLEEVMNKWKSLFEDTLCNYHT